MTMEFFVLIILVVFASENNKNDAEKSEINEEKSVVVKIEENEIFQLNKKSEYIGVYFHTIHTTWRAQRRSKAEKKNIYNGCYGDEETAAHASDNLARKLMENGEKGHKLNLSDAHIEVYRKRTYTNRFIGVSYNKNKKRWQVRRRSKNENKKISNGYYSDEETAAHASDTLARTLMKHGEQGHKLNFSDDRTEVYREEKKTSKFIGVSNNKNKSKWIAQRWSKNKNKKVYYGYCYDDEETAAHASDTLARELMKNGEQGHKLNFPDDFTEFDAENQNKKRKRPKEEIIQSN